MVGRCPGSDNRWVRPEYRLCTSCGYEIEFFSDQGTRRCPKCGSVQTRETVLTCAAWCQAAGACLGDTEIVRKIREAAQRKQEPDKSDP